MNYDQIHHQFERFLIETHDDPYFKNLLSDLIKQEENRKKIQNERTGIDLAHIELARRQELQTVKSEKSGKSVKYLWITVNPKPQTPLPALIKSIHKMYSKKWIQGSAYVFETTNKEHNHSHGLIKCQYEYARAIKELKSTVEKICDTNNSHCFNVALVSEEIARQKYQYLKGLKQEKKQENVNLTINWRQENKIKPLYEPLTLLGSEVNNSDSSPARSEV